MYPIRKQFASKKVSNMRRGHCFRIGDNVSAMKNQIEKFRKEAGVTLEELGRALQIGRSGMQKIQKKGIDNLKVWQVMKMSEILKKDPREIMGVESQPQKDNSSPSDGEIALTDVIKALMALLLKNGIMSKPGAREILNYLRNSYPDDMKNAHAIVDLLAAPVTDKFPAKDFQAMLQLWQHVPAGRA